VTVIMKMIGSFTSDWSRCFANDFQSSSCSNSRVATVAEKLQNGSWKSSQSTVVNANDNSQHNEEGHSSGRTYPQESASSAADTGNLVNLQVPVLTINERLASVSFNQNKLDAVALRRTILSYFSSTDTYFSKKFTVDKFSSLLMDSPFVAERYNSSIRAAHEAEIDDIINTVHLLDSQSDFDGFKFASNLKICRYSVPRRLT